MRGNQIPAKPEFFCGRSIPACAGEPIAPPAGDSPSAVYPRVCGGTTKRKTLAEGRGGLSPRVRGNPAAKKDRSMQTRSIPACAGEPLRDHRQDGRAKVYPRVCGGTASGGFSLLVRGGLSPRVRGNLINKVTKTASSWSIPACAGEPARPPARRTACRVYPRVCGGTPAFACGKTCP